MRQRSARRALAVARLQHPQLARLDGELHVLHVAVVLLEDAVDADQLRISVRHGPFHRRLGGIGCLPRRLRDVLRRADAGDHVLALRIDEELAVELLLAGRRVAREGDAGGRGLAHVAEHHRLHVDGSAPRGREVVELAVFDGAGVHPRAEHGADRAPQLLVRILREGLSQLLLDDALVAPDQALPIVGLQVGVEGVALAVLVGVESLLEMMVLDAEHHVRIHGDEAPVAVIGEARVARRLRQRLDGRVVEAEIEHRVHHARHGGARARAHRHEQRVLRIAEAAAGEPAHIGESRLDLAFQLRRIGAVMRVVIGADLGRDREAGRHGQAEIGHLGEVGALAAEEVAHARLALGLAVAEGVDPLRHHVARHVRIAAGRRNRAGLDHRPPKRKPRGRGSLTALR